MMQNSRADSVFAGAIHLSGPERARFLTSECGTDEALRASVERLLAAHDCSTGLLDRPLFTLPPEPEDVWSGRVLHSRYRIERFLARGGMSTVYLARDEQLAGKPVVVKFLHSWARQFAWLKEKFRGEMEALARVHHPAVVAVLDFGETADGLPFLVIEYVEGVTLRAEMAESPMPIGRAARIIRETGRAAAAAHATGVLHRDLKPENIMLERPGTSEERVRLIDFGIARMDEPSREFNTRMTQFAGTTPYMAPEQLRGKPSAASDIYGLAVVAYELLTGVRPFPATSPVELYEQQRAGVKAETLRRHGVSEAAARVILKQLSFRAEDRGPTANEAAELIAEALLHPVRLVWTRRRVMTAAATGVVAGAAGGVAWWMREPPLGPHDRVIDMPLPSEPLEHGFQATGEIDNRVVSNADHTGFEALRLISDSQGGYHRRLTRAQVAAAHRLGWRITFEATAEEGILYVNLDMPGTPVRYLFNVVATAGGPGFVRLPTAVVPKSLGVDLPLTPKPGGRHRYVFGVGPRATTAEVWVDGIRYYSGYKGLTDFRYQRGPEIGVAAYGTKHAAGVVWKFRFEIG